MTIPQILKLPNRELKKHLETLAKEYFRLTGIIACTNCRGEIQQMIKYLKDIQMETQFRFKTNTYYRIQKGKAGVIHNGNITDELAFEFLAIRPERIELFAKYPENWKDQEPCPDSDKRKELTEFKMNDLRQLYPDVPAPVGTKKKDFIEAIIESEKA